METGINRNRIIAELTKSPHGKLEEYHTVGAEAAIKEPDFLAHLISWNRDRGEIRDSKIAIPIITLATAGFPAHLVDNSLAHLAMLAPRYLVKAIRFGLQIRTPGHGMALRRTVLRYLRAREENWAWWERTALQHRDAMKSLYTMWHFKPQNDVMNTILFGRELDKSKAGYPRGSVFEAITQLTQMSSAEAAGTIIERKIPFLIAKGALGAKFKEPDLLMALIDRMSPAELVNNTKML